jgi:hypothetical protein
MSNEAREAMTGDDLITLVTRAATPELAAGIVHRASVSARYQACDLLYVDADAHGMPWMERAIVREARAGERTSRGRTARARTAR